MKKEAKTVKKVSTKTAKKVSAKTSKKVSKNDVIAGNEIFDTLKPNRKVHLSFGFRVSFCVFSFCLFIFAALFLIISSIKFENAVYTNYTERGTLDYRIHLKPNSFYEKETLEKKDRINAYVASLINSIDAIYDYKFDIDENTNMRLTYDVVAKLSISDDNEERLYLETEYPLLSEKEVKIENGKHASINETINIDYNYYNNIANGFKSTYGINSKSNLMVTLRIHKISDDESSTVLNGNSVQQLKIPLSERAINVNLDFNELNNDSFIIHEENVNIDNIKKLACGIICLLLGLYYGVRVVRLYEKTSVKANKFDKYVNKILRTYDRLIVESKNTINMEKYDVIKVNRFEELLDVRDNLKLPINYYVVTPHQKAEFYIISTNVYMYTVKEVDLENQ